MEDDVTIYALVGTAGVAILLLLVFSLTAGGSKARRRMAALGPQRERA